MASLALEDGDEDAMVVLACVQLHEQANYSANQDEDEVMISTVDVYGWNFPSILQNRIVKIEVPRNRLIEHSSYFRGLLGGKFGDPDLEILVQWNQPTFLSLLASLFGSPMDITSENFLSLFEGALYFGMETILSECKLWLTKAISINEVVLVQLNDLVSIWEFGSELANNYLPEPCTAYLAKNFIWAMSCSSFCNVPYEFLLSSINHPHLTVDSEKQLCDALLNWISANKERYSEDFCINLLKQIRFSLLPLWFAAGMLKFSKVICIRCFGKQIVGRFLSLCCNESFREAIALLKQPLTGRINELGDDELLNLRFRLTQFSQRVDLSCCPQINPAVLLLSILPFSLNLEPQKLGKEVEKLLINHEHINTFPWTIWPNLTFKAIHEIDISNCPMLPIEAAIQIFIKSFPSLRKLKAANHLGFKTLKVCQMAKRCPLLSDIDLSVDVSPITPTHVSILSSFPVTTLRTSSMPWYDYDMNRPFSFNITKLTLEGRIDISDFDVRSISNICASLTYISLKGCTSVSDAGISALISKCLKLNSIVACDTFFGQQSVLALCSSNAYGDDDHDNLAAKQSRRNIQMLHIGGCKGINMTCLSKLMSHAYMLKSLCLRETQVVDDVLFSFSGTSLEVLDVSNTKVSGASVAYVISKNPGLKCLRTRGCNKLIYQETKNVFIEVGRRCLKLDEISAGWGFSYLSLEALKPAVSLLKAIEVGLGGSLGEDGLKWLPTICPLLESVILYFQVISDDVIVNMLESLKHLKSFELCHCLGETSSLSFNVSMPNLRKLTLERVTPWLNNVDLVNLSNNCANLIELSLLGCKLLNSESQKIISAGWPGLVSIHLEECGQVTRNGVVSLFDCHGLEDILLRHNGFGIQKGFISEAVTKLPMLRKISIDICDAKDRDFDFPEVQDRHFVSHVKIARCKSPSCSFHPQHVWASMVPVHQETLVLVWDSKHLTTTVVKERL